LPIDTEAYCAVVTPWKAYVEEASGWVPVRDDPFDEIPEAYRSVGRPAPDPLTLDAWHEDFGMIEQERVVPPLVRVALDRFSGNADAVFVRCYDGNDVHNWRIDRSLFFELPDPFVEMPRPVGTITIFPRDTPWFMLNRDDEPILYLAGPAELVSTLDRSPQAVSCACSPMIATTESRLASACTRRAAARPAGDAERWTATRDVS
jgi:hypothetical protein